MLERYIFLFYCEIMNITAQLRRLLVIFVLTCAWNSSQLTSRVRPIIKSESAACQSRIFLPVLLDPSGQYDRSGFLS